MTDADLGFLSRICADPGDDTHRLAFADYLEETAGTVGCPTCKGKKEIRYRANYDPKGCDFGNDGYIDPCPNCRGEDGEPTGTVSDGRAERAELIRVQCELARDLGPNSEPRGARKAAEWRRREQRVIDLRRRERELLETVTGYPVGYANEMRWFGINFATALSFRPFKFSRGFVSSVTCTATDWLAHADALLWHPEQTVPCEKCGGKWRSPEIDVEVVDRSCPGCKGKGTVPRPCPPTAQPITRVVLTDLTDDPDQFCIDHKFAVTHRDRLVWTSPEWPGVEFDFPPGAGAIAELMSMSGDELEALHDELSGDAF